MIRQETTSLASFGGKSVSSLGIILLTTRAYDLELKTEFTVVDHFIPFDAIVGHPWLHQMRAVPSDYHQCVKFLCPTGEKTILESQNKPEPVTCPNSERCHGRRRISHSHATSQLEILPRIYRASSLWTKVPQKKELTSGMVPRRKMGSSKNKSPELALLYYGGKTIQKKPRRAISVRFIN